jgi:hypothetical protein
MHFYPYSPPLFYELCEIRRKKSPRSAVGNLWDSQNLAHERQEWLQLHLHVYCEIVWRFECNRRLVLSVYYGTKYSICILVLYRICYALLHQKTLNTCSINNSKLLGMCADLTFVITIIYCFLYSYVSLYILLLIHYGVVSVKRVFQSAKDQLN